MKITVKTVTEDTTVEYPILMKAKNSQLIVLFGREGEGTIIKCFHYTKENYKVGEYRTTWQMENFEPFTGTVLLENN